MAGAAVIAAVTNALGGREFPFVFGGDGASFAVSPGDADTARAALAATAAWADGELGLTLRVALIPLAAIRTPGARRAGGALRAVGEPLLCDVLRRRPRLGRCRGQARRIRRRAGAARQPWPDLTGLSCRFEEFRAARGLILAVLVLPAAGADPAAFRALTEEHRGAGRTTARSRTSRCRPAARSSLAAARRGARDPHHCRAAASGARACWRRRCSISWSCARACASAVSCRQPICARSWKIPTSANTTTGCA